MKDYKFLKWLGDNIIASEFDEWKLHRTVSNPAFVQQNLVYVCSLAGNMCKQMFAKWEGDLAKGENTM